MKNLRALFYIAAIAAVLAAVYGAAVKSRKTETEPRRADTVVITRIDTVVVTAPAEVHRDTIEKMVWRVATADISRADSDSVAMELPVVSVHYSDTLCEAWVSGPILPRLDSIRVFARTERIEVTVPEKPPSRWHLGISAGYAATPAGFEPFVGIGITYSLISF